MRMTIFSTSSSSSVKYQYLATIVGNFQFNNIEMHNFDK